MDYFEVLGVRRLQDLDLPLAEERFRTLSRQFHPDRFAKADPRARRISLQRSVQLNEAWRTIKDPVRRAEYLLHLAGYEIGAEQGASRPGAPGQAQTQTQSRTGEPAEERERIPVPPALLGEILELREALGDARAAGDDARVQQMAADIRGRVDGALLRVSAALAALAESAGGGGTTRTPDFEEAARELVAIRYFRRFLDEVAVHDESVAVRDEGATRV